MVKYPYLEQCVCVCVFNYVYMYKRCIFDIMKNQLLFYKCQEKLIPRPLGMVIFFAKGITNSAEQKTNQMEKQVYSVECYSIPDLFHEPWIIYISSVLFMFSILLDVQVWNSLSDGICARTLRQHSDYVTCLAAAEANVNSNQEVFL